MTALDLEAIQKRVDAASPGPWNDGHRMWLWVPTLGPDNEPDGGNEQIAVFEYRDKGEYDLEFCANARQDIPALLAEVRRLRAGNDVARKALEKLSEGDYRACHGQVAQKALNEMGAM